ncbi:MAG: hypothetical protein R3C14_47785 [Caldilineaceae bacterium]
MTNRTTHNTTYSKQQKIHQDTLQRQNTAILDHIREGMTVYDSNDHNIGSVATVYFGAASEEDLTEGTTPATADASPSPRDNSFVGALADVFDPRDQVPDELAERLRYNGYIKIDGGWFGSDRYIMPSQISSVSDEGVYLSTERARLIQE